MLSFQLALELRILFSIDWISLYYQPDFSFSSVKLHQQFI